MNQLNRDFIKIIALLLMAGNHWATIFLEEGSPLFCLLVYLGYATAPIMCYFLVEGFYYTHSRKNYGLRLAVFALVSEVPFYLAFSKQIRHPLTHLNMIYSLLICFLLLCVLEGQMEYGKKQAAIFILFAAGSFGDWSVLAQFFTLLFWDLRRKGTFMETKEYRRSARKIWTVIAGMTFLMELAGEISKRSAAPALFRTVGSLSGPLLAGFLILYTYNGRRISHGRLFWQWFCYLFYPVHLLILGTIAGTFF